MASLPGTPTPNSPEHFAHSLRHGIPSPVFPTRPSKTPEDPFVVCNLELSSPSQPCRLPALPTRGGSPRLRVYEIANKNIHRRSCKLSLFQIGLPAYVQWTRWPRFEPETPQGNASHKQYVLLTRHCTVHITYRMAHTEAKLRSDDVRPARSAFDVRMPLKGKAPMCPSVKA
jgi:hypothetical protein